MSTALDQIGQRAALRSPQTIGQQTAVEQARAVAQVAAAVQVAQQFPRDVEAVRREVVAACSTMALARKAFYAVQNRGEGKSVHLARELARIWGNFESGVHELSRDDDRGQSEIQAFAWDIQTNNRSTRVFIAPHQRMKSGKRVDLVDLQDIYLNNQNTGARAVRECVFAALPDWLVDMAEDVCRQTLAAGDGKPIEQRIRDAVGAFDRLGVKPAQLEQRIGRPSPQWDGEDIASLEVVWRSIKNGETTVEEQFESVRVTAAELTGAAPKPPAGEQSAAVAEPAAEAATGSEPCTRKQLTALNTSLTVLGYTDRGDKLTFLSEQLGRQVGSSTELSKDEASALIDKFKRYEVEAKPAPAAAADPASDTWVEEPPADWQPEDGDR